MPPNIELKPMAFPTISVVPCNGCTRCCHGDAIRMLPDDTPALYQLEVHDRFDGELMLAHKVNGDCVYLDEHGCTIHATKPIMCREMDCRLIAKKVSFTTARKLARSGRLDMTVWFKGRELLSPKHKPPRLGST